MADSDEPGTGYRAHPWARWSAFVLVALIGLAVRLPQLGVRPMHTDEAVNAYIVGQILSGESFTYDPQDRHGPALAALAFPLARAQGAQSFSALTESELRVTSVVAGTITILLFGAAIEMFGFIPCLLAAILFAVAPLPVYYDRYFIHESLFCAATFGLIFSGWRAWIRMSIGYGALAGASAAFMIASKETAILHLVALAVAAIAFKIRNLQLDRRNGSSLRGPLLAAVTAFAAIIVLLFSWFGRSWKSLLALAQAVPDAFSRAAGQGHEQPFWYFGKLLVSGWSGGVLVALTLLGLSLAFKSPESLAYRFLANYSVLIVAIYSLIPYKTPWLALNFWLPIALFVAIGMKSVWRRISALFGRRGAIPAAGILAACLSALIARDTRQRVFLDPAGDGNPYAYAHTSSDILGLPAEIEEMARRNGIANPRIAVVAADPWPLPWYLRHFENVGFWQPGQEVTDADFYVTSTEAADQYAERLRGFQPDFFGSRPGVLVLLWLPPQK